MVKKILSCIIFISLLFFISCSSEMKNIEKEEGKQDKEVNSTYNVSNEDELIGALINDYSITLTDNITTDKELVLEGDFSITHITDEDKVTEVSRKLYLRNDNKSYTLKSPKLVIRSKNTIINGGNYIGDIEVEAIGFVLNGTKVEGNVYLKDKKMKDSFKLENKAIITGKTEVK